MSYKYRIGDREPGTAKGLYNNSNAPDPRFLSADINQTKRPGPRHALSVTTTGASFRKRNSSRLPRLGLAESDSERRYTYSRTSSSRTYVQFLIQKRLRSPFLMRACRAGSWPQLHRPMRRDSHIQQPWSEQEQNPSSHDSAFAGLVHVRDGRRPHTAVAQATAQIPLQFDFLDPGARSLALGSAFTAVADDATAAFTNPGRIHVSSVKPEFSAELRWETTRYTIPFGWSVLSGTVTNLGADTVRRSHVFHKRRFVMFLPTLSHSSIPDDGGRWPATGTSLSASRTPF